MKKIVRRSLLALLAISPLAISSCTVLAVGAVVGTAYYVQGEYVAHVSGTVTQTVSATNSAALDLNIEPTSRTGDASRAVFHGIGPDGKKVTIKILPDSAQITKIKIRVGVGDKKSSEYIFQAIQRRMRM
ncbi:MAG: DUF3568 family protein [Verrucomicrobiota bacterium]